MSIPIAHNKYYLADQHRIVRVKNITRAGVAVYVFSPRGEVIEETVLPPASFIRRVYKLTAGQSYRTQGGCIVHIQKNPDVTNKDFPLVCGESVVQRYTLFGFYYLSRSPSIYDIVSIVT